MELIIGADGAAVKLNADDMAALAFQMDAAAGDGRWTPALAKGRAAVERNAGGLTISIDPDDMADADSIAGAIKRALG